VYALERLESLLGCVQSSRLGVCHRVQLGASLRACMPGSVLENVLGVLGSILGVYLGAS